MTIGEFLKLCEAAACAMKIAEATLSTRMLGDGKRISQIRSGKDIGARRLERAADWFAQHWPEGTPWPADVPRPGTSQLAIVPINNFTHAAPAPSSMAGAAPSASSSPDGMAADARGAASAATLFQTDEVRP